MEIHGIGHVSPPSLEAHCLIPGADGIDQPLPPPSIIGRSIHGQPEMPPAHHYPDSSIAAYPSEFIGIHRALGSPGESHNVPEEV